MMHREAQGAGRRLSGNEVQNWEVVMLRRLSVVFSLVFVLYPPDAQAFGGNGEDPSNQINKATQRCALELSRASSLFAFKRAKALTLCIDGIVRCDQQITQAKADLCRRKLIRAGSGKCAVGRLDLGVSTLGAGAVAANFNTQDTTSALGKELRKLIDKVQLRCFDVPGVDLTNAGTGLFFEVFGNVPETVNVLVDFVNSTGGLPGAGCFGNHVVRRAYPLADALIATLVPFHLRCALPKDGATVNTFCTTNAECGSSGRGRCGLMAQALREGNPGMMACMPLP